ncbi:MAG: hypothetical protein MZV65_47480 [Chromatiales bacterium]|nr:hypothetical protein [Chromatiales bacterium]
MRPDAWTNAREQCISGFVMTLEDITRAFELDSTRDMLLQSFTEGSRAALANIRAAVETLTHYPDCELIQRDRFLQVIGEEVCNLSHKLDQTTAEYADSLKTRWPLRGNPGRRHHRRRPAPDRKPARTVHPNGSARRRSVDQGGQLHPDSGAHLPGLAVEERV